MPPHVTSSNNPQGGNQHHARSLIRQYPQLPEWIQKELNDRATQKRIQANLKKKHGVKSISIRSIQSIICDYKLLTPRKNGLTTEDELDAVRTVLEEDPLGRMGKRTVQEKLGSAGIHVALDSVAQHLRDLNPDAVQARRLGSKKAHPHGLWSIGSNEEWGVDGHEKLRDAMGIAVWGIVDKFSRMELLLCAMPNARERELPPALFLRAVKRLGGMPLTVTTDKGTELGLLIPVVTTLRQQYHPYLPNEVIPAVQATDSRRNITRERNWRPLYEKQLSNILFFYQDGKAAAGFMPSDNIHSIISYWLWGRIVQLVLDETIQSSRTHKIRHQKHILLPSGARRCDIYDFPDEYEGCSDQLITIPGQDVDKLLIKWDRPDLLQFGSDEEVGLCEALYEVIGSPSTTPSKGWAVFQNMVAAFNST